MKNSTPSFPISRSEKIYGINLSTEKSDNWHEAKNKIIALVKRLLIEFPSYTPERFCISRIHMGTAGSINIVWSDFRAFMFFHTYLNKALYEPAQKDVAWHYLEGHGTDYICSLSDEAA